MRLLSRALLLALAVPLTSWAEEQGDATTHTVVTEPQARAPSWLHLFGSFLGDPVDKLWWPEVGASVSVVANVDLAGAALPGPRMGAWAGLTFHSDREGGALGFFAQLRAARQPISTGESALGAGLALGGSLEVGPGRVTAGIAGEAFRVPDGDSPLSLLVILGYELDVPLGKTRVVEVRTVERVREAPATPTSAPSAPPPAKATALAGRVVNVSGEPIQATVSFPGAPGQLATRALEASPTFEARLPPGRTYVELSAAGYLRSGRWVTVREGETLAIEVPLRPVPGSRTAELLADRIELRQPVEFATGDARILPESYRVLDEVVDLLLRNPKVELRVIATGDESGKSGAGEILGESRAVSVINYFIERGVAEGRLAQAGTTSSTPPVGRKSHHVDRKAKTPTLQLLVIAR